MLFTAEEVLEITSGKLLAGTVPPRRSPGVRRVTTDSREVRPGDLFVALIGEHFNGHDFLEAAVRRGAVGAVVQEEFPVPGRWQATRFRTGRSRRRTNPWIIGVLDPLTAYQ
ncbi:MAG: Mur ligase domain-containing protein, partial [Nitrospirales bacterium]